MFVWKMVEEFVKMETEGAGTHVPSWRAGKADLAQQKETYLIFYFYFFRLIQLYCFNPVIYLLKNWFLLLYISWLLYVSCYSLSTSERVSWKHISCLLYIYWWSISPEFATSPVALCLLNVICPVNAIHLSMVCSALHPLLLYISCCSAAPGFSTSHGCSTSHICLTRLLYILRCSTQLFHISWLLYISWCSSLLLLLTSIIQVSGIRISWAEPFFKVLPSLKQVVTSVLSQELAKVTAVLSEL